MSITSRQAVAVLAGSVPALRGIYILPERLSSPCDSEPEGPISRMKPICRNLCNQGFLRGTTEIHGNSEPFDA
jgi:hypothetical protein